MYNKPQIHEIVLLVNGYPRSGKDTFAKFIEEEFKYDPSKLDVHFENISTVSYIKKAARDYFDWDGEKDEKGRRLLADLKDASRLYNEGPFNFACQQRSINYTTVCLKRPLLFVSVIHSREPEEIQMFKNHFGDICRTVFIKRDIEQELSNHADRNVEDYKYNYTINNNSDIKAFKKKCNKFINNLFKKISKV